MTRTSTAPTPRSYMEAAAILDAGRTATTRSSRKIAGNTWLERRDAHTIAVRFHETDVVTWTDDNRVTFRTGGWNTNTTRERLNRYAPEGASFYTRKRVLLATFYRNRRWDDSAHYAYSVNDCDPAECTKEWHMGRFQHDGTSGEVTASEGMSVTVGDIDVQHGGEMSPLAPPRGATNRYMGTTSPTPARFVAPLRGFNLSNNVTVYGFTGDQSGAVLEMPEPAPVWRRA